MLVQNSQKTVRDGRLSFEDLIQRSDAGLMLQGRDQVRYSVKCSFLEIYNETITDLLKPGSGNLNLREDMKRGCYVDNLTEQIVLNGKRNVTQASCWCA